MFPMFKVFCFFLLKQPYCEGGKPFLRKHSIDTHSTAVLLPLANFKKTQEYFSKNPSNFFLKKPQFLNVFRNLTISVRFYGKFATVPWKKTEPQAGTQAKLANIGLKNAHN